MIAELHDASGERARFDWRKTPKRLIRISGSIEEQGQEIVINDRAEWNRWFDGVIGDGENWTLNQWQGVAPIGSLYIDEKLGIFVKFDNEGDHNKDWALQSRCLPVLDQETLEQLTIEELEAIRDAEETAALERMKNQVACQREIDRRAPSP